MDPLSLTLAVVTLATAVKDLVELAQAICDAFAKVEFLRVTPLTCHDSDNFDICVIFMWQVPQNYKKSLHLASDILRTSKKMQTLYGKKKEVLESAEDLRESLQELNQSATNALYAFLS